MFWSEGSYEKSGSIHLISVQYGSWIPSAICVERNLCEVREGFSDDGWLWADGKMLN